MSPARFRWGIILVQMGVLILLANLDVINYNFFLEGVVFIAVVLIFVGIEKIFTKSRLQFISYLTSVGILVAGFAIAFNTSRGGSAGSYLSETTLREKYDPDVQKLLAVLDFDNIDLTIRDAGNDLFYGRFDELTAKPKIEYKLADNGLAQVNMTKQSSSFFGGAIRIDTDSPRDWNLRFSDQVPLDLECYGEDSDIHLNLSTSPLENLKLDADNAKIYVRLGNLKPLVNVSIVGDDSSLKLRVPKDIGLRITGEDYGAYLLQLGFVEGGDGAFMNEGFDTLQTKIQVDLDFRLKSFVLDYF